MAVVVRVETNRIRDVMGRFAKMTNASAVEHSKTHVQNAATMFLDAMKQEAPVGKPDPLGRPRKEPPLARNLKYRILKAGNGWKVSYSAPPHARFVLSGTSPHPIVGGRWPLHFYWDRIGAEVWLWKVQHPGTAPNRFDQRAMDRVKGQMDQELGRGVRDWIQKSITG